MGLFFTGLTGQISTKQQQQKAKAGWAAVTVWADILPGNLSYLPYQRKYVGVRNSLSGDKGDKTQTLSPARAWCTAVA